MTTMSSTLARRAAWLAAASALLLGPAACGDDDDGAGAFCDQARDIDEQMTDLDLESANIADIASAMAEIEPPAEIADDWNTMVEGFERLADVDLSDPEAFGEAEFSEAEAASDRVTTYLEVECGIDTE
jgi:hypothetical protein